MFMLDMAERRLIDAEAVKFARVYALAFSEASLQLVYPVPKIALPDQRGYLQSGLGGPILHPADGVTSYSLHEDVRRFTGVSADSRESPIKCLTPGIA
jgi:hypothetical protein